MFEKATRLKLRFETSKGLLSVEDLWEVPLTGKSVVTLDGIAQQLHKKLRESEEVSFVLNTSRTNDVTQLQFDLVKHIIDVRLTENAAVKAKSETNEKKQKLMAILAQKEDQQLMNSSVEDIRKMLEAM